jgi:hypothetical protein
MKFLSKHLLNIIVCKDLTVGDRLLEYQKQLNSRKGRDNTQTLQQEFISRSHKGLARM